MGDWNEKDWTIDRKVSAELAKNPFNGDITAWADWKAMIRNHLISCNQGWGRVIHDTEMEKLPLTFERLSQLHLRGMNVNLNWLTKTLWAFLCQQMTKECTMNLNCLVGGEELTARNCGGFSSIRTRVDQRKCR